MWLVTMFVILIYAGLWCNKFASSPKCVMIS